MVDPILAGQGLEMTPVTPIWENLSGKSSLKQFLKNPSSGVMLSFLDRA